jgi:uncharacterized protein
MNTNLARLEEFLAPLAPGGLCVAFSGGVDSAVLLAAACKVAGAGKVHAVTMQTPFHSPREPKAAAALAAEMGAIHSVITLEELDPALLQNPADRCYRCKFWVFSTIQRYAAKRGLATVLDGTNAEDLGEYRPGLRALKELGIVSPLAQLGIAKAAVREMAAAQGISVAQKPSAPCLATRFPYDTPIRMEELRIVDELEHYLKSLGPQTLRVRVYGDTLRLEVLPEDFSILIENRADIAAKSREAGFLYVTMDLEGFRSGSMDIPLQKKSREAVDNLKII